MTQHAETQQHVPMQWLMATDKGHMILEARSLAESLYPDLDLPWLTYLGSVYEDYFRGVWAYRLSEAMEGGGISKEDCERRDAEDSQHDIVEMINMAIFRIEAERGIFLDGPISVQVCHGI